jgi:hypothetical protein
MLLRGVGNFRFGIAGQSPFPFIFPLYLFRRAFSSHLAVSMLLVKEQAMKAVRKKTKQIAEKSKIK